MTPLTVMSGIGGERVGGVRFPRWTIRLIGRLTISEAGLSWTPMLPWRKPRLVEVPWTSIRELHFVSTGSTFVDAEGWVKLMIAPSKRKRVLAAVEECGFVLEQSPARPDDVIARRAVR